MRNQLHFVAALRNLFALANVAILAAERFAVSFKPELSHPRLAGISRPPRRCRQGRAGGRGDRYGHTVAEVRSAGVGYWACDDRQMTMRRCATQES